MKRVRGCFALFTAGVVVIISLINFPLVNGTPSRFSLFQGSPYSSSASRQRNKNWCAFVVHKNVSCAVLSNEEVLDPQLVDCPPNQDCSQHLTHHIQTRPTYKIGYKQVTELEWRCCPGYQGHDCTELKNTQQKHSVHEEPYQDPPSTNTQLQSILGVHKGTTAVKASVEGSKSLSSQSVPAHGVNSSGTSITGYAGAPGYPQIPAAAVNPDSVSGDSRITSFVSFSAGLTLVPFPEKIGIIRFNKVLLNDGRHYDPNTGVFTAPVDGRYLLSAVLTAEEGEGIEAFLSVSNRNIQKLFSAESDDCECGGSVAVSLPLHLKRGQRVGLVLTAGKLAISTSSEILSSFSAVLLYPTLTQR
ncbi:uncharacterized protein emilin2b isoform X2 [Danio rerio]|uniref:Uncharacterized protein emilin2b isoform X2 n=2 Tax=Danio rerio TaxID=7955 RepID=A0AC58G1S7_DANRE|nr:EMILIN-2 isoform X2 [Danio rerio]|eukprot:XP_021333739.1 EMILIN-2 isoform X2 [Danio rerio]